MKEIFISLEKETINLILKFEIFSICISFIGIIELFLYLKFYPINILYIISIATFKAGLFAGIASLCSGIFFNGVKKGLIHK